jgi:uncharacterized membrane protein YphA (DoxX/SURF4 family)
MWALTKLPEFDRAYRATDATWTAAEAAATLQFPMGLMVAVGLATPFWTAVGFFVHHLAK